MTGGNSNPFQLAQEQVDRISKSLTLDDAVRQLIRRPLREYTFAIPVRVENGPSMVFEGFRVQHNDARGPGKGGIRFHPQETLDGVRARAMWNTWRCAVVDIPLGGSMGGVVCDPHTISSDVQEKICRGWVRQMSRATGPDLDIPEPDIMTNPQHMLWMLDEFEAIHYGRFPGFITGKPVSLGGSLGRMEAAGYGMIYMLREALRELGVKLSGTTAAVQGFGNVARHAVGLFIELGGTVLAVSCLDQREQRPCTFRKKDGVVFDELVAISDPFGGIDKERASDLGYEVLPGDAWLQEQVDVLLPAAFEYQISGNNANDVSDAVRIVVEGADSPITPNAERILIDRGVVVIPDYIASAGGIICSYFEQVQSNANHYWPRDEVLGQLDVKLTNAYRAVRTAAGHESGSLRDAALGIGIARVAQACSDRGWI